LEFTPEQVNNDIPSAAFERAITRVPLEHSVVFGSGVVDDRLGKSLHFNLNTTPGRECSYEDVPWFLESASEHINANLERRLGYSIRVGDAQLMGKGIENLRQDIERLPELYQFIDELSNHSWRYGPVLSGYTKTEYGILWFELQKESETFNRWTSELLLPDIPFDSSDIEHFVDETESTSKYYAQRRGIHFVHLNGRKCGPLQNPTPVNIRSFDEGPNHVLVDNPFYDWPEVVHSQLDESLPEWCKRILPKISKIPFEVSGGYLEEEDQQFSLNYLDCAHVTGTHPTLLVDCSCWPGSSDVDSWVPE
jgi:hypothetical protein